MNSLSWCCPRVPVPDPEIGLRLGNDLGGASDVEAPRCEKLLAGFRLRGMRPEASRDRRPTPRGRACQGRVRLVPLQNWRRSRPLAWAAGAEDVRLRRVTFLDALSGRGRAPRLWGSTRPCRRRTRFSRSSRRMGHPTPRHLLVADVLGRLLAGRRALHKLLAEILREVVVRGAADELLRLLPLTRGPVLF